MELQENYLRDIEEELEFEKELEERTYTEQEIQAVQNFAEAIISQDQIKDRGNLLGHYKSGALLKTYINIYEKAICGIAEKSGLRRPKDFSMGYIRLKEAIVEGRILYLIMNDGDIYRIRHLRNVEIIAYQINQQKRRQ